MVFEESLLFKKLKELGEDCKRLVELINNVEGKFREYLESINCLFGDYTDHGIKHSKSVLKILERDIIGKDRLEKAEWVEDDGRWKLKFDEELYLALEEVVLLLLAVLLHDIGMSPEVDHELNRKAREILECLENEMDDSKRKRLNTKLDKLRDKIREKHNEISAWFIKENYDLKKLFKDANFEDYIDVLAFIVEAHRFDPVDIFQGIDNEEYFEILNVRPSLLAFLLELADDMDIGYWRVDFERYNTLMRYLGAENVKHIFLNKSVRFVKSRNAIVYKIRFPSINKIGEKNFTELMGLLYKWWDKIETRIDRAKFYGGNILGEWRGILPPKVEFDVSLLGDRIAKVDLSKGFEADKSLLTDLLSREVYGNHWEYAFRELIANAFDAIKRRWVEEKGEFDPKIRIDVKIDSGWVDIRIEDNGIGMSPADIEDYLLKVGRSFYRELREKDKELASKICPISYYGIGFLSAFMLLRSNGDFEGFIEVESKKRNYDAVKILIFNPNLPVVWMKTDRDVGTTIRIKCKHKEVKEYFEDILKQTKNKEVRVFPFQKCDIVSSVFERLGLRIPIEVKINNSEVWNDAVEPSRYMGELIEEVEADDGKYKLKIFKTDKFTTGNVCIVNGISCNIADANLQFQLFEALAIDGQKVKYILNVEAENVRFMNIKKSRIELPEEIVSELFRNLGDKLKYKNIYLDVISDPDYVIDNDFKKVGAIKFVKSCLRFRDIYGNFVSLEEIEKMGKIPIIININFLKKYIEKFEDFFRKKKLHPLDNTGFLVTYTPLKTSYYFFKMCKDCRQSDYDLDSFSDFTYLLYRFFSEKKDCIFDHYKLYPVKIKDSELRDLLFENFGNIAIIDYYLLLDNAFIRTICEMWKSSKESSKLCADKGDRTKMLLKI